MEKGLVGIHIHNLRDFGEGPHKQVDDLPYGGGAGMVLMLPPLVKALEHVHHIGPKGHRPYTLALTPQGTLFNQKKAQALAKKSWITLLCGRYEGFDERLFETGLVDEELSIGDYILGGGELPALVVIETVLRLLEGVVGNPQSVKEDSFSQGILDYPQYTRPRAYWDLSVPDVLLSGDPKAIARFRRQKALEATLRKRPDLLKNAHLSEEDQAYLRKLKTQLTRQ